jgi:hypothetical protein
MLAQHSNKKVSPVERWEIITTKLMKKRQTKDVSWFGGFKVAKIKVIDRDKKN